LSSVHKALVTTVIVGSVLLSVVAGARPGDAFVIDSNNALVQAAHSLKELANSKAADCFETDVKKCLPMKSSGIQATGTLAQVVVHSDVVAAVQTATNTIASLNERVSTQPVNVPAPRTEPASNFVPLTH
jgi:hypothetical protein